LKQNRAYEVVTHRAAERASPPPHIPIVNLSLGGLRASAKTKPKRRTTMKTLVMSVILSCAAGLAGCNTFASRAHEKASVYNSLAPQTQQRLEKGMITIGDTEDMVFIALNKPEVKREITTSDGTETVWIYKTYWEEYADTGWVGWHRFYQPWFGGRYSIYHERVPLGMYRTYAADVIRITFKYGKVISLDQAAAA